MSACQSDNVFSTQAAKSLERHAGNVMIGAWLNRPMVSLSLNTKPNIKRYETTMLCTSTIYFIFSYDAFLTSKYILLTPCFLALYRGPNHSIRPHFVHILPPTPTWHGKAKSHLIETQFYMLWVWKSPKSRCCSEKKCNKIFEAPFSKLYRHSILKKKIL